MGKYIDVEKLLAKIEWLKGINIRIACEANKEYCRGYADAIEDILHTITSLQQEQPEVDLEKEVDNYQSTHQVDFIGAIGSGYTVDFARHFYELARQKYEK